MQLLNISGEPWFEFLIRLLVNMVSIFFLIRFIYYPKNSRIKYLFTFFLMGMMIFLIASLLDQISLDMGFALGLFAIFGIIRYRSPSIDLKEMTYLFLVIGVSIINALVEFSIQTLMGLFIANFIIIVSAFFMENYKPRDYVIKKAMVYSPSDYSIINNNQTLLEEIRQNTGIDILRVEIEKINIAKNEIAVWIYFREESQRKAKASYPAEQAAKNSTMDWESTNSNHY
ncbi:MAG TPA: DUF4956 domain-containing protein [Draconibacterium sp.]|nr:DUF4956 domain-containing protein [Draconibacterium sp.]